MTTKMLIVDDHRVIRDGLRALLASYEEYEVVGEASSGHEALEVVSKLKPDLCIMDIGMPDLNGIDATQQLLAKEPELKVIALSMYSDAMFVSRMFEVGAWGYVLKQSAFAEIIGAIDAVRRNEHYLGEGIASVVVEHYRSLLSNSDGQIKNLTAREREILQLLSEGKRTREIAELLNISVKTIESHRKRIMDKLGLKSIAELTKFSIRHGLTELFT